MPSNLETAKRGYELFGRGDIPTLLKEIVDDSCRWVSPGPEGKLPWAGSYKGKQEIGRFFATLVQAVEFTEFMPRDMIERGDTVVVIGNSAARIKSTGKTVKSDWVDVLKFNDSGKLVYFQAYDDTATTLLAMS